VSKFTTTRDAQQWNNRAMDVLMDCECGAADVADALDINLKHACQILSRLTEFGLIEAAGKTRRGYGRPATLYRMTRTRRTA
jgi:predicted ArsR family transcriptional regulator